MSRAALSRKTLSELKRKHTDFLVARLASRKGRHDFERSLRESWAAALRTPVREIVEPRHFAESLVAVLDEATLRSLLLPILRDLGRQVLAGLREMDVELGELLPHDARAAIDLLLERPDLVPERLLREVLEQQAVEHALRDVIFDALRQFHDKVNPFFADWGVPAMLSWLPIGGSAVRGQFEKVRAEFDRRLDPEIRKFLLVFSRQATTQVADAFLARSNDPSVVAMRRHVAAFLYRESVAKLAGGLEDEALEEAAVAADSIAVDLLRSGRLRDELRLGLQRFVAGHGERSVGEWMRGIGVTAEPDFAAVVELLWPGVLPALRSPVFRELVERINGEFYDSLVDAPKDEA